MDVEEVMLELTPKQKEVLLLRSRGLSSEDIAAALGLTTWAVSQRFYDARLANPGHSHFSLVADYVRELAQEGVWE